MRSNKESKKIIAVFVGIICIAAFLTFVLLRFQLKNTIITGNSYYSSEEIIAIFASKDKGLKALLENNTLYIFFNFVRKRESVPPLIETLDMEIESHDTIKVSVVEKSLVACVKYMGYYMVFDREGIVIESLKEPISGITLVTGLKFDHIAVNDKIFVENDTVFARIVELTNVLKKKELSVDAIDVSGEQPALWFGQVRVELAGMDEMDAKLSRVSAVVKAGYLDSKKGSAVLRRTESGEYDMVFSGK